MAADKRLPTALISLSLILMASGQNSMSWFQCTSNICDGVLCPSVTPCVGLLMPSYEYPCSCCQMCLSYIEKGERCSTNSVDKICGPGLTCTKVGTTATCQPISSSCTTEQAAYDQNQENGLNGLFMQRPLCDENGDFVPRKCQPGSSCTCVDKNNKKIFGEAPPSKADGDMMNCACSRQYAEAVNLGTPPFDFPHCSPNGNYDSLQCFGLACFCMDSNSEPTTSVVPLTAIQELPCYNPEIHYPEYYRPCETEARQTNSLIDRYAKQNVTIIGTEVPDCTPDGFYSPVRKTESTLYCVDPYGDRIESFQADIDTPQASNMSCTCARTRYWLAGEAVTKPSCCGNGDYERIQCRSGYCFCVDPVTGDQDPGSQGPAEVFPADKDQLHCYNNNVC